MTAGVHALAAVAVAALVPDVIHASESGDVSVWLAAVLGGLLPNAVEWLARALARADALYTPDPALAPDVLAADAAHAVARVATLPLETGRAVRLRIRPLPPSAGRLALRFLDRSCDARVIRTESEHQDASAGARIPEIRPLWPAEVDIAPPDGALLEFRQESGNGAAVRIDVRATGRGRGFTHSVLVLGAGAFGLFATGNAACAAAGAGLLAHAVLDAGGLHGIPLVTRRWRMVALRRWNDESATAQHVALVVSGLLAALGFVLHTAYLEHERRLVAVALAAAAVPLLREWRRKRRVTG